MRVTEKYACEQEYEVCDWCGGGGDTKASECMIAQNNVIPQQMTFSNKLEPI